MQKFITVKDWMGQTSMKQRMVNQPEIVDYISRNPGKTENQIMKAIYGYDRNNNWASNKKYADCLRRALYSEKISRVKAKVGFIYYV